MNPYSMYSPWKKDDAKNILSAENLGKLKSALERGLIFGYHYRPHSGAGPVYWVFDDFTRFMEYVAARSKPGDWYGVCSLQDLLDRKVELAQAHCTSAVEAGSLSFPPESIQAVKSYLEAEPRSSHEIVTIYYLSDPKDLRIDIDDLADYERYWLENVKEYNRPGAEIYVFPYGVIDDNTPEYMMLEAQYPNEQGEVFLL